MFTSAQAVVLQKIPLPLEFVGSAIGIIGALVLTIPEKLIAFFKWMGQPCGSKRNVHVNEGFIKA